MSIRLMEASYYAWFIKLLKLSSSMIDDHAMGSAGNQVSLNPQNAGLHSVLSVKGLE